MTESCCLLGGSASQGKHNGQSYIIPVDISSEPPGVMVLLVIILSLSVPMSNGVICPGIIAEIRLVTLPLIIMTDVTRASKHCHTATLPRC